MIQSALSPAHFGLYPGLMDARRGGDAEGAPDASAGPARLDFGSNTRELMEYADEVLRSSASKDEDAPPQPVTSTTPFLDSLEPAGRTDSQTDTVSNPIEIGADQFSSDEFRLYKCKVMRCPKTRPHDWTNCPYAHPGEKAARRDPLVYNYRGWACPEFRRAGSCPRGDACPLAHGVFECWLHPSRYRTMKCVDGAACTRKICFFAHNESELRVVPPEDPARIMELQTLLGEGGHGAGGGGGAWETGTQPGSGQASFSHGHDPFSLPPGVTAEHVGRSAELASLQALLADKGREVREIRAKMVAIATRMPLVDRSDGSAARLPITQLQALGFSAEARLGASPGMNSAPSSDMMRLQHAQTEAAARMRRGVRKQQTLQQQQQQQRMQLAQQMAAMGGGDGMGGPPGAQHDAILAMRAHLARQTAMVGSAALQGPRQRSFGSPAPRRGSAQAGPTSMMWRVDNGAPQVGHHASGGSFTAQRHNLGGFSETTGTPGQSTLPIDNLRAMSESVARTGGSRISPLDLHGPSAGDHGFAPFDAGAPFSDADVHAAYMAIMSSSSALDAAGAGSPSMPKPSENADRDAQ
ncbi:unnamed protein product [Pedinophyceae sp. YPF-701]|nr:unnamed protein product [Pedinophyceae sp. YPF-701]